VENAEPNDTGLSWRQGPPIVSSEGFTFIIPIVPTSVTASELIGTDAFHGRIVNDCVDIDLIRGWFENCASTHRGSSAGLEPEADTNLHEGSFTVKACRSRLVTPINFLEKDASVDEERGTAEDGCRPRPLPVIPNLRLVNIALGCVTEVDRSPDYAALSDVWGTANRLLLCNETEMWLFTPGTLTADNERIPKTFRNAFTLAASLSIRCIWIDALCIVQDNPEQLLKHSDTMEAVYGSAVLTIVNDTLSVYTGIYGVSVPRGPPQASFIWAGTIFLGTRKTFGEALNSSCWERRAWCLQEKIFSKRLLGLTEGQAFYHCAAATWCEDTVMEPKDRISGVIHMRERNSIMEKVRSFDWKPITLHMKPTESVLVVTSGL
jgi:hypothetical protein